MGSLPRLFHRSNDPVGKIKLSGPPVIDNGWHDVVVRQYTWSGDRSRLWLILEAASGAQLSAFATGKVIDVVRGVLGGHVAVGRRCAVLVEHRQVAEWGIRGQRASRRRGRRGNW
jgi:hypothetical protein